MLSEISQLQKGKYCMIQLYKISRVVKIKKQTVELCLSRHSSSQGWEMGSGRSTGLEVEFARWKISRDPVQYNNVNILNTTKLYT